MSRWTAVIDGGIWSVYEVRWGGGRYRTREDAVAYVREQQQAALESAKLDLKLANERIAAAYEALSKPVRGAE